MGFGRYEMKLKQEIDKLQQQLDETYRKLCFKTCADNIVEQLNEMIKLHRGATITPDSASLVSICVQLRALLLAEEVGAVNVTNDDKTEE